MATDVLLDHSYALPSTEEPEKPIIEKCLWNFHRCLLCPYRTRTFDLMNAHINRHDQRRVRKWFICHKSYRFLKSYKCKECPFGTALMINYVNHLNIAHNPMFKLKQELNEEINNRNFNSTLPALASMKNYRCKNYKCGFVTNSSLVYLTHSTKCKNAKFNGNETRWFPCKSCGFIARRRTILNGHVRVKHTQEQKYNYVNKPKRRPTRMKKKLQRNRWVDAKEKQFQMENVDCGANVEMKNRIQCEECSFETEKEVDLKEHMLLRHFIILKPVNCVICDKKYPTRKELYKHLSSAHYQNEENLVKFFGSDKSFRCDRCDYRTNMIINFTIHSTYCQYYRCKQCTFKTPQKSSLDTHVFFHHNQPEVDDSILFECGQCKFHTKSKDALFSHKCNKHGVKCDKCSFISKSVAGLKIHKNQKHHKVARQLKCGSHASKKCEVGVRRPSITLGNSEDDVSEPSITVENYEGDMTSECSDLENVDSSTCVLCTFQAKSAEDLKKHIMEMHILAPSNNAEIFQCDLCSYKTATRTELTQHVIKKHLKPVSILRYKCEICYYNTTEEEFFEKHIVQHEVPRGSWLKCQLCSFKTTKVLIFREHTLVRHIAPKDVTWTICKKCSCKKINGIRTTYRLKEFNSCGCQKFH